MSSSQQNTENYRINAYDETIESYEQLHHILEMPQYHMDTSAKVRHLRDCFQKIQCLIHMELDFDISSMSDFDADICSALFLLREHLIQMPIFARSVRMGVVPVAPAQQVPPANTSQNPKTSDDDQLKKMIKATEVIPRVKGFTDIAGLKDIKTILTATVILPVRQPQLYINRKICNSVLLYGPPGTGKTQLAHALAAESCARFFSVTSSSILSHYVGQTEKKIRVLFETVKEARDGCTVLFMDEIDGLCRQRNDTESEWNRRLKTELMCHLSSFEDCHNVFLICATNCPWDLDPAFLRRFQQRIYVPLPRRPERFELLQLLTRGTSLESTFPFWSSLLTKTEGYSGSDLADLVRHAMNIPLTELVNTNMWESIGNNKYKPATGPSKILNVSCALNEMPMYSVQARPVQISDLMAATDVVHPTVSSASLKKYEEIVNIV